MAAGVMKADSSKVERNRKSQTPSAAVFKTLVNLFVFLRQTHFPEALSHSAFFFLREHMKSLFFCANHAQRSGEEKNIFLLAVCLLRRRRNSRLLICGAC